MNIRTLARLAAASLALTCSAAFAEGDPERGKKLFRNCRMCHTIQDGATVISKGGRTGPNLFGVIGRQAGSLEGFRYGKDLVAAGKAGLVWDAALLDEYVKDPKKFLKAYLDDATARSRMGFKLRKGGEDVAAYLASVAE